MTRATLPTVVWSASLFSRSGYAEEARNVVLALDRAGVDLRVNPRYWLAWERQLAPGAAERLEELVALDAPEAFVHVMHDQPQTYRLHPAAAYHVGRTMWETDSLPSDWVPACNALDEVWVPSDFNLETFSAAGVAEQKLHKVPEGIDTSLYERLPTALELEELSGFVFLSVFSWSRRKGWDVLVRSYLEEFSGDEDVTLALLVTPFTARPVSAHLAELNTFIRDGLGRDPARCARIVAYSFEPGAAGMPALYRAADAFVLPSRGEGWGRAHMEAMACGLPTIGTGWSGNLEFMNEHNSYLVDYELAPVDQPAWLEWLRFRGQRWAEPSVEHLRELMRRIVRRPEEARAKGERARADVLSNWTWETVAEAIVARLRQLEPRPARPPTVHGPGPSLPEATAAYERGMARLYAGQSDGAEQELRRALALALQAREPRPAADAYLALARLALGQGRLDEAAHHARRSFDLDPSRTDSRLVFAAAVAGLGLDGVARRARRREVVRG